MTKIHKENLSMRAKIKRRFAIVFSFCLVCTCVGVSISAADNSRRNAFASSVIITDGTVKEFYMRGESFSVPKAKLSYSGAEYDADTASLEFPDGRIYTDTDYILERAGRYRILYSAKANGALIKGEKIFLVKEDLFSVTSALSKAEFTDAILKAPSNQTKGLSVTLAEGDKFSFNLPFDLSGGLFEFLKIYPHSNINNAETDKTNIETNRIIISLTDAYDATIRVDFVIKYCETGSTKQPVMPYMQAGAAGQPVLGLERSDTKVVDGITQKEVFINQERHYSRYDNNYGRVLTDNADDIGYTLAFNTETNEVFVKDNDWKIVNVLDNEVIYDMNVFGGFTTGEVYLSIKGSDYLSDKLNFDIELIGGILGDSLKNAPTADSKKPVIDVDYNGANPDAVNVALGEPFVLFNAKAYDINLKGGVKTAMYYGYGTEWQSQIGIENNRFTPAAVGTYTIIYAAEDTAGNKTYLPVNLNCIETPNGKGITFSTQKAGGLAAGEITVLPDYAVNGINGEVNVEISAVFENGEITLIDPVIRGFCPMDIGTYEIVFNYRDAVNAYSYSYECESVASNAAALSGELSLPEYFIKGIGYSFNDLYVFTFDTGKRVASAAQLYVSEDGGLYKLTSFDFYKAEAQSYVRFKIMYSGAELAESGIIPVVDVGENGSLKLDRYFQGGFFATLEEDAVSFKADVNGGGELNFISPLSLANFRFDFRILSDYGNFGELEISLIDFYDRSKKVTFTYKNNLTTYTLSYNGGAGAYINKAFTGYTQSISYQQSTGRFSVTNFGDLKYFDNSAAFTSDKVLLHISLKNMRDDSGIDVQRVCNQAFSKSIQNDDSDPIISFESAGGRYARGTKVTISTADAVDVLSGVVKSDITVAVQLPGGKGYAKSTDGILLDGTCPVTRDYQLELAEYGQYIVRYSITDQHGKSSVDTYFINVVDMNAPVLTINNGYAEDTVVAAKLNSKVKPEGYSASDDIHLPEELTVFIVTIDPNGCISTVKDNSFTADKKGDWKILYYCCDGAGNYTMRYYTVRVA